MEEEIWKEVIRNNKIVPNYWVSNLGRVKSSKKTLKVYNESYEERGDRQSVGIMIPKDLFGENYSYSAAINNPGIKKVGLKIAVHRLVAETFKPIDEYPPIPKEEWDLTPESAKKIIRECCWIDHIDDNPFNNHVDNLRWVTPKQNNVYVKKQTFKTEDKEQNKGENLC